MIITWLEITVENRNVDDREKSRDEVSEFDMAVINPRAFPQKLLWLFRYLGWYRTLKICVAKPFELLTKPFTDSEWFWWFTESQLDARYGIDTLDTVPVVELDISDEQQKVAVFYEPCPVMEFGYVISRLPVEYKDCVFVDLGSGKGRALLLAGWFPFKKIVGVEISAKMHAIAKSNIDRYQGPMQCDNVQSVCADAGACDFPSSPMVVFLFNPFNESILELFLKNLHQSLQKNPRRVVIVYNNPKHREAIDATKWLSLIGSELDDWYLIYETNSVKLVGT